MWITRITASATRAQYPSLCPKRRATSAPSTRAPPLPSASSCFVLTRSTKQGKRWSPVCLPREDLLLALVAQHWKPHFQTPAHKIWVRPTELGCPGSGKSSLPQPHAVPHSLELAFWGDFGFRLLLVWSLLVASNRKSS